MGVRVRRRRLLRVGGAVVAAGVGVGDAAVRVYGRWWGVSTRAGWRSWSLAWGGAVDPVSSTRGHLCETESNSRMGLYREKARGSVDYWSY